MPTPAPFPLPLPSTPFVRLVRGSVTDEELAAVTVVLTARLAAAREDSSAALRQPPVARWSRVERLRVLWAPTSWRRAA